MPTTRSQDDHLQDGPGAQAVRFNFRHLAGYLLAWLVVIGIYDVVLHWPFPFRVFTSNNMWVECPLVAGVLLIGYFPELSWKRMAAYTGLLLVLTAYASFDIYYHYFKRAPRPSDLQNTVLIWNFAPKVAIAVTVVWTLVVGAYLGFIYREAAKYSPGRRTVELIGRGLALLAGVGLVGSPAFEKVLAATYQHVHWSTELSTRLNGRFSTFMKYGNTERAAMRALTGYAGKENPVMDQVYPGELKRRPNIYIIVLESFLDPRLVRGAHFSPSPLAAEIRPFLANGRAFSRVRSPVYGGNSTQAEFELLTGLMALARIESVEFNVMKGGATDGLVHRLKQQGYHVYATKAANSSYFNVRAAYGSLGFTDAVFFGDDPARENPADVLFDGDFFAKNLERVRKHSRTQTGPMLHYMVGMYGHFPYTNDTARFPDVIKTDYPDPNIGRIANQFYYRTQALGRFLSELKQADPQAIFYVTSDHLPPVFGKSTHYIPENHFVNIALLMDGDRIIDLSNRTYFEVSWLLWDLLTGGGNRPVISFAQMESAYMKLLADSLKQNTSPAARSATLSK